jgi:hypothetical protein
MDLSVSCKLTTTPEGTCVEGTGIIPDTLVENTKMEIDVEKIMS